MLPGQAFHLRCLAVSACLLATMASTTIPKAGLASVSTTEVQGRLSSKTPYKRAGTVHGSQGITQGMPSGSRVFYLFMLARHGTRWPTLKDVHLIQNLESLFKVANPKEEYAWVRNWFYNFDGSPGQLHPLGEIEMQQLGMRTGLNFPDLLAESYKPSTYTFVSSQIPRAAASAKAFAKGLFPCAKDSLTPSSQHCRPPNITLSMQPADQDRLLRFYKTCPKYDHFRFRLDPEVEQWTSVCHSRLIPKLEEKLGLSPGFLTQEAVGSMWKLCQQQSSLLNKNDEACGLFESEDIDLMEYCDDVKHFEEHGHASCNGYAMATSLASDIATNLREALNGSLGKAERARFYFAHDHTLAGLAAWLGLFGSPGPCSLNETQALNQKWSTTLPPPPAERCWRGSKITPFAANLGVILYQPPLNKTTTARLLWNERAIPVPWCNNAIDCSLSDFLKGIHGGEACSFDDACRLNVTVQ